MSTPLGSKMSGGLLMLHLQNTAQHKYAPARSSASIVGGHVQKVVSHWQPCYYRYLTTHLASGVIAGHVAASTTQGTVIIFDYKTLHRGPANTAANDRPMLSLVYSRSFFLNGEAIVNRAVPLLQTLHQRRYWESYFWHPVS